MIHKTDDKWEFSCDRLGCGGFTSRGHPTKAAATARQTEHDAEHDQAITEKGK